MDTELSKIQSNHKVHKTKDMIEQLSVEGEEISKLPFTPKKLDVARGWRDRVAEFIRRAIGEGAARSFLVSSKYHATFKYGLDPTPEQIAKHKYDFVEGVVFMYTTHLDELRDSVGEWNLLAEWNPDDSESKRLLYPYDSDSENTGKLET